MNQITNSHQNQNKVIVSMGYDNITTQIDLIQGQGTILPDPLISGSYDLIWWNASDYINPTDDPFVEVVKCIAKMSDILIVIRSQQQTLASHKNIPGKLYNMSLLPNLEELSYYNLPQPHGSSRHTGTIGDHTTNLLNVGNNTHTQIDTALTASAGHIAASGTSVHSLGTMSTQSAGSVTITGGTITGITNLSVTGNATVSGTVNGVDISTIPSTYVSITAGQTINVTDATTLQAALDSLIAAPSLAGNVIIHLAAGTATGSFTIPVLIYNGYTLTIEGELSTTLTDTATGGVDTALGSAKGYCEKTTATWTVDAYKHLLLQNPSGQITPITSNTATRLYYTSESATYTKFNNTDTILIKNWASVITNTTTVMTVAAYAQVTFKNLKISGTSGANAVIQNDLSTVIYQNCLIDSVAGVVGSVRTFTSDTYARGSVFKGDDVAFRMESNSLLYCRSYPSNIFYLTGPYNYKSCIQASIGCFVQLFYDFLDGGSTTGNQAVWANMGASGLLVQAFVERFAYGSLSTYNSNVRYSGVVFTSVTYPKLNDSITITSSATPTPDCEAATFYTITALAEAATFGAPTGYPADGQKLTIRIKDNGTARALSWNTIYRAGTGLALPTTTVLGQTMFIDFMYNAVDIKWDLVIGGTIAGVSGGGGGGWTTITISSSPFTAASDNTILCNASGGVITINLPAAASNTNKVYNIKKIDSSGNSITIDANASETIDGTLTKSLNLQYESITIQSDGSNWYIL